MKLYVKTQGKLVGPLDWDRILVLHENGRLPMDATVSEDKNTWLTIEQTRQLIDQNSGKSDKSSSLPTAGEPSLLQSGLRYRQEEDQHVGYMPSQPSNNGGYGVPQPPNVGGYVPQPPNVGGYGVPQPPNVGGYGVPQPPNVGGYGVPQPPNGNGFNVQKQVSVYPQNSGYNPIQNPNTFYSGGTIQNTPANGTPMNTSNMMIANVWERFVALLIDIVIMNIGAFISAFIVGFVIGLIAGAISIDYNTIIWICKIIGYIIQLIFCMGYEAFFLSKYGATPGKMLFHLKVLHNGQYLTISHAIGRYFAQCLSGLILGIGYFMAFFNQEHKALHDNICDTIVVKQP